MNPETISRLVEIAFQYGPFFFAILFLLVVSRWTYKTYKEVCVRQNPTATEREITTSRYIYIGSFAFGLLLVGASVIWWFGYRPKTYIFRGTIRDLKSYELIDSDANVYFKPEFKQALPDDDAGYRNEHFILIQDAPFRPGQFFEIDFSKKGENDPILPTGSERKVERKQRNRFRIEYDSKEINPIYIIEWDSTMQKNVLRKATVSNASNRFSIFEGIVHAQQIFSAVVPNQQSTIRKARAPIAAKDTTDKQLAEALQGLKTDVGTKIVILEKLDTLNMSDLKRFFNTKTENEPVLATVLDLTRHSDKELAFKADRLLQKLNLEVYLAQQLQSPDMEVQKYAGEILLRIDKTQAESILQRVNTGRSQSIKELSAKVSLGQNTKVLRPTGSSGGDRYYVKAVWDPNNKAVVDCLTALFNKELESKRPLDQEAAIMRKRSSRLVYSIYKDWSLSIVDKITSCGGKASFVTS